MAKAKARAVIAGAVVFGLVAAFWSETRDEIPRWRPGGTISEPARSVTYAAQSLACPDEGARIVLFGDSHVAGSRMGREGAPFGEVLEQTLEGRAAVRSFGIGGQTAAMGEASWRGRDLPQADLVILAYGTNDAAPRGWLSRRTPVPVKDYAAAMTRWIEAWRMRGAQVAVLAPPPGGSAAIAGRLAPYREAAGDIGRRLGVAVLDPADAFAGCAPLEPLLARDALHMNPAGHRCLGQWLARRLCPE